MEKVDIAEVINQMVKRACLFKGPKTIFEDSTTPTTPTMPTMPTTTSTATAYRKLKAEMVDRVLMQPVVAGPAYPNLVSNIK